MKKLTLFVVMALLCLNFRSLAQQPDTIPALKVGDKLPANFWSTKVSLLDNTGKRWEAELSIFKGKALLIDFWACWCGACINHFVQLNQIQQHHPDLAIIPVNTKTTRDTDQRIIELTSGKKYRNITLAMPTVVSDTRITQFFPHHGLPHYVWISKDGRVKAISMSLFINEPNINLLLNAEQ
ncbi:MAG: TlpA disulfide reductase family protein [Pedobacter sp.]|nr:TlpA disulfide reductase family protein [Pedobacter sp.]MDQ8052396.1 TlpA disulfide reductase family protein [Pedobacter sp.]